MAPPSRSMPYVPILCPVNYARMYSSVVSMRQERAATHPELVREGRERLLAGRILAAGGYGLVTAE